MNINPNNLSQAIREKLISLHCECHIAEALVAELVRKLIKQVEVSVWLRPLRDFKQPDTIVAAMWLQTELVAVEFFEREASHHHLRDHFSPRAAPAR